MAKRKIVSVGKHPAPPGKKPRPISKPGTREPPPRKVPPVPPPVVPGKRKERRNPAKVGPNWEKLHNRGLKRNKRKKGKARAIVLVT